jgi:hypothetical protein
LAADGIGAWAGNRAGRRRRRIDAGWRVGSRARRGRDDGGGRWGRGSRRAAFGERREHRADLDLGAFLGGDAAEHARTGCVHLDGDLVGLKLHQRLVRHDRLAGFLQPARDGRRGDAFAQRGHLDLGCHAAVQSP